MILLPNITFNIKRSTYDPSTKKTLAPTLYSSGNVGHIGNVASSNLKFLPAGAAESEYYIKVETGTDIRKGDQVESIFTMDGDPWPTPVSNETWVVEYVDEGTAGILSSRKVFINRVIGGGPAI